MTTILKENLDGDVKEIYQILWACWFSWSILSRMTFSALRRKGSASPFASGAPAPTALAPLDGLKRPFCQEGVESSAAREIKMCMERGAERRAEGQFT